MFFRGLPSQRFSKYPCRALQRKYSKKWLFRQVLAVKAPIWRHNYSSRSIFCVFRMTPHMKEHIGHSMVLGGGVRCQRSLNRRFDLVVRVWEKIFLGPSGVADWRFGRRMERVVTAAEQWRRKDRRLSLDECVSEALSRGPGSSRSLATSHNSSTVKTISSFFSPLLSVTRVATTKSVWTTERAKSDGQIERACRVCGNDLNSQEEKTIQHTCKLVCVIL